MCSARPAATAALPARTRVASRTAIMVAWSRRRAYCDGLSAGGTRGGSSLQALCTPCTARQDGVSAATLWRLPRARGAVPRRRAQAPPERLGRGAQRSVALGERVEQVLQVRVAPVRLVNVGAAAAAARALGLRRLGRGRRSGGRRRRLERGFRRGHAPCNARSPGWPVRAAAGPARSVDAHKTGRTARVSRIRPRRAPIPVPGAWMCVRPTLSRAPWPVPRTSCACAAQPGTETPQPPNGLAASVLHAVESFCSSAASDAS